MPKAEWDDFQAIKPVAGQAVHVATEDQFRKRCSERYEAIMLDSGLFKSTYPWEWMCEVRQTNPEAAVSIALSDEAYPGSFRDVIFELADRLEFSIVPLGTTRAETLQAWCRMLPGDCGGPQAEERCSAARSAGRLAAVISSSPKDGATTIAVTTALCLAERTDARIGLLDLNLKDPDLRDAMSLDAGGRSLQSIKPYCSTRTLTPKHLLEHCVHYKGFHRLHLLPGTHRRDTAADVTMDQMHSLLETARETFDIVIADVHTFPDNAATVHALKHADERWLVTQPVSASFRSSWPDWYEGFWRHCGLRKGDFSVILNRCDLPGGVKAGSVISALGASWLGEVADAGAAGIRACNEGVPLWLQDGTALFRAGAAEIAEGFAGRSGFPAKRVQPASGSGSYFRRFLSGMSVSGG